MFAAGRYRIRRVDEFETVLQTNAPGLDLEKHSTLVNGSAETT